MTSEYFSVDRRGFYKVGGMLELFKQNPFPWTTFLPVEGLVAPKDLEMHLMELFPDGISLHGWHYMTSHNDFLIKHGTTIHYANYEATLELVLEYVRCAFFPQCGSRLQSYFAFSSLEAALAFRTNGNPIYRLEASSVQKFDQNWLRHGNQSVTGSYSAHKYWSGKASPNPKWEHLLTTPVRVLEQVA
jgi:hypothetical protein